MASKNSAALLLKLLLCLLAFFALGVQPSIAVYKKATPGYHFQFPQDHCSHTDFKTEWWYYTGHLKSKDDKSYGFELTFFRLGGDYEPENHNSAWRHENYHLAHFAVTDENSKTFFFDEKVSHARHLDAGASTDTFYVHNQGWSVKKEGENFILDAESPQFSIHLTLEPLKQPVIHGIDGVTQKDSATGDGTHCYSMTRLKTAGQLLIGKEPVEVSGQSWMDHEFGTYKLTAEQCGWDWYCLQLDDNRELMLCMIRRIDGTIEPASSGTIVDEKGSYRHLTLDQVRVLSSGSWHSEKSGGTYPMGWYISVPSEKLDVNLSPTVKDQELNTAAPTGITYWEGAVNVQGTSNGKRVTGQGYVEMTGYCEKFKESII